MAHPRRRFLQAAAALGLTSLLPDARGQGIDPLQQSAARRWVLGEFNPSTLTLEEQLAEMDFFINASAPFRGQQIHVVSETIPTHVYEQRFLARAFREITGIRVRHDLLREGELVERLLQQSRTGRNLYDAYVNDADFLGTHYRMGTTVALSDWMEAEGADFPLPTLDLADFIGLDFTTGPDGKVYQLPDQQFVNLYWFRHDWFQRPALREAFRQRHGYELDVPVNWKAYEDIADFFTNEVREIDGERVYGHMDYARVDPSLGWRFTDAWLSLAGVGDVGRPNGQPVDEWGIRVENCHPVGSTVSRGGALNSPAAVYALRKYLQWMRNYAPPEAWDMDFSDAGPVPARGDIAQQVFWYTAFTPELIREGSAVMNSDGSAKWRVAPSPRGAYWKPGMKGGYQDCGAWTLLESTPLARRQAAWLYAQFTTCKSVSLKKTLVGLTPFRESDLASSAMGELSSRLGGLVEFYRSPARDAWTPTGVNVPDYARLAQLWWVRLGEAVRGRVSPELTMNRLAAEQDELMARLADSGLQVRCAPRLNEPREPEYWLSQPGAPKPALDDEAGQGETVPYETLLADWRAGRTGIR